MKKQSSVILLAVSLILMGLLPVSCNKGPTTTPEEEVRNYSKYFIEKLTANQLDSLKVSYTGIANADSIVAVKSDTILVEETTPGKFNVTLADGINLKIERDNDGEIKVTESKGLFAFPADKVDIAKKTGMWDDNLSDAQLNERMKDEEFFKYIQDQIKKKTSNILTVGKETMSSDYKYNLTPIINNTDQEIKATDYTIISKDGYYLISGVDWISTSTINGKDIAPHDKYVVKTVASWDEGSTHIIKVNIKIPKEELVRRFASFTGKEYKEYLNSKK